MFFNLFKISGRLFIPLKALLPHQLMGRGMLIIFLPLFITELIAAWAFYDRHFEIVTKRMASAIGGEVNMLLDLSSSAQNAQEREELIALSKKYFSFDFKIEKPSEEKEKNFRQDVLSQDIFIQRLYSALNQAKRKVKISEKSSTIFVELIENNKFYSFSFDRKRLFSETFYVVMGWFVLASLISFGIAAIFLKNQIRPILKLARAADAFGQGQEQPSFKPEGATEVRLAGRAFLRMRRRLSETFSQRSALLAGISHDLRTPLTRMKLRVSFLNEDEETKAELLDDITQMQQMIAGYLDFVQQNNEEAASKVDLLSLFKELAQDLQHKGQWDLQASFLDTADQEAAPSSLYARRLSLKRALQNLLVNALQYKKDKVIVTINQQKDAWVIMIDDDGEGIAPSQRQRVFDAFTRLDAARNPQISGVGLGLTITRDLLISQGAKISLHSAPLGGLRVVVRLVDLTPDETVA